MSEIIKQEIPFVNLHMHGTFSINDAIGYPEEFFRYCYSKGMNAAAMSEHGNLNSLAYSVQAHKNMLKEGIDFKNIYAIEAYFIPSISDWKIEYEKAKLDAKNKIKEDDTEVSLEDESSVKREIKNIIKRRSHLLLIAKDEIGLSNLFKLVSKSYHPDNFYRYPRLDFSMLKEHHEGIIASTACISGILAAEMYKFQEFGEDEVLANMRKRIEQMIAIFGVSDFLGELQFNDIAEQHKLNDYIIRLSCEYGFTTIVTTDAHMPSPDMWRDRELYKRLGWISKSSVNRPEWLSEKLPESIEELKYELYPKNGREIFESYKKYSARHKIEYDDEIILASIENTYKIAERIKKFLPDNSPKFPRFILKKGENAPDKLTKLCIKGLREKGLDKKNEYKERLKEELKVIRDRNFCEYFLTMKEVSDVARSMMLSGPARGSAASALVSYTLGITEVDPLKWGLQFERFMARDSTSIPDIDYDTINPAALREKLKEKWGEYSVLPISNFNTFQMKSLIKDIGKYLDIPYTETNEVTSKMMEEATPQSKIDNDVISGVYTPTFEELMKYSPSLINFLEKYPQVGKHIKVLQGQIKSTGQHAAGNLIIENLDEKMPLIAVNGKMQIPFLEGQRVRHLESIFGYAKTDLLGLSTLKMLELSISKILKRHFGVENPSQDDIKGFYDKHLHPDVIDLNNQDVWENIFHKGNFAGIFQFSQEGAREFCKKVKPRNIVDLSIITSVYRPGPLAFKVDEKYLEAKADPKSVIYIHPIVEKILKGTYYLIFQEQLASLAHELGKDISLDDGNTIRKMLTKKGTGKEAEIKEKMYGKFLEGCIEKGISKTDAEQLLDTMERFSQYSFNKAHAVSYSIISFQCGFLLRYYTAEWLCAFLEKEPEARKEAAINTVKQMGFEIEPVHLNKSGVEWEVSEEDDNKLVQPLTSIHGMGSSSLEQILLARPFNTLNEFIFNDKISYNRLNKAKLDVLIRSQAANFLIDDRFDNLKHFWLSVVNERPMREKNLNDNIIKNKGCKDFTDEEKLEFIVDLTGVFPMDRIVPKERIAKLKEKGIPPISELDLTSEKKICWGVIREAESRKTTKGKDYMVVKVLDSNSMIYNIRCWGINGKYDSLYINHPYVMKLDYSEEWGFSTKGPIRQSWKMIG